MTIELDAKRVLDPCCGSRMMWFDKESPDAIFGDKRSCEQILCDGRALKVSPGLRLDFRNLPFGDAVFNLVVFDPPHLRRAGEKSWLRAKYGVLGDAWQNDLRLGFAECFRVLSANGVLVFKWAEDQIKIKEVLALTTVSPLFGHTTGAKGFTHWVTFIKPVERCRS